MTIRPPARPRRYRDRRHPRWREIGLRFHALLERGSTKQRRRAFARRYGVSVPTLYRWVADLREEGALPPKPIRQPKSSTQRSREWRARLPAGAEWQQRRQRQAWKAAVARAREMMHSVGLVAALQDPDEEVRRAAEAIHAHWKVASGYVRGRDGVFRRRLERGLDGRFLPD